RCLSGPDGSGFVASVSLRVMRVPAGMPTRRGVVVGAVLTFFILRYLLIQPPGWLAALTANIPFLASVDVAGYVQRSNYLIFGLILVFTMLLRPQGLIPSAQRKIELELGTTEEAVADLRGSA